jgi:hypothetical protein
LKTRIIPVLIGLLLAISSRAEHFDIDLTIEGAADRQEAHRDDYPPFEGRNKRPVFHGKAGEPLRFQFLMTNVNPHDVLKRVGIRYYLVSIGAGPLAASPGLAAKTTLAGEFTLDFKVQGKLGLKQQFRVQEPGRYLFRLESSNSGADHEHFSAIELDIR